MTAKTAIGIARQSHGDGESVEQQRARIVDACERDGMTLLDVLPEQDVSGGRPLAKRPGLLAAVEAVEAGEANVVVAAYFDRLVRSLKVQWELVERVEAAGGSVLALDTGEVTNGSAGQWLSAGMLGLVSEYHRRTTAERTRAAQVRSADRGIPPGRLVPGLARVGDHIELTDDAPTIAAAITMRAAGASIPRIREHLREHGIERSHAGVAALVSNPMVAGAWTFGDLSGTVPTIVDPDVFRRAQRTVVTRGRKAKSDRLLARLGVLRCAGCGARMVVGSSTVNHGAYYRCPPTSRDCEHRVTIAAELVEQLVVDAAIGADVEVLRSDAGKARLAAEQRVAGAEEQRSAFRSIMDATDAGDRDHLARLTSERDEAREALDAIPPVPRLHVEPWDELSLEQRREVIVGAVESVTVRPGRGEGRVDVKVRVPAVDDAGTVTFPGRARRRVSA